VTPLLPGAGQVAFVDVDDTVRATDGYAKQGAGPGYTGVNGLNALLATISTPLSAPVIAATRLRRGAVKLLADALAYARRAGATGLMIVRADSAFYSYDVAAAARRAGARFSLTARLTPAVTRAITSITNRRGPPSATPTRSTTPTNSAGSPTPKWPRCPLPRSPAGAAPSTSPPG
jgi:hypothetical protein